jgi:formate dehydrogenase (coenzyme F420) beta subunit
MEVIRMNTIWVMETHGDPLQALNKFVQRIWQEARLDGVIVSSDSLSNNGDMGPRVLEHAEDFSKVNPFRPVMRTNTARYIPDIVRERPDWRLGVVLRPCEMRALNELERLDSFPRQNLVTLCIDCLGTYTAKDIQWRTERAGSESGLVQRAIQFAGQGGVASYRYRPACQVCQSPQAKQGDINIGMLGLPVRQQILVEADDLISAGRFNFQKFHLVEARTDLRNRRERILSRVAARNSQTRERIVRALVEQLPANLNDFVDHLDRCGECHECLNACPLCTSKKIKRDARGHYKRQEIAQWLAACSGCGMCEQACQKGLPLSAIFGTIREQLMAGPLAH